jgi:Dullard-like phosphatase family protein
MDNTPQEQSSGLGAENEEEVGNCTDLETKQETEAEQTPQPYVLLLDLDETIIRSSKNKPTISDYGEAKAISYNDNDERCQVYVILRPYLEEFISEVSKKYKIYIYTSATAEYAEACLTNFDFGRSISGIFSRKNCKQTSNSNFEKDIFTFGFDETRLVFVDDWKSQTIHAPKNSLNIKFFNGRRSDTELLTLKDFLVELAEEPDVRSVTEKFEKFKAKTNKKLASCLEELDRLPISIRGKLLAI